MHIDKSRFSFVILLMNMSGCQPTFCSSDASITVSDLHAMRSAVLKAISVNAFWA